MDHIFGINYKGDAAYHDMIIDHHKLYVFGLIFYTAWQTWSLEEHEQIYHFYQTDICLAVLFRWASEF